MEALEAKMKKIYDDNKVIIEGEIIEEDDKVKIKDVLNEKG